MENKYDSINTAWKVDELPPVTRQEATRALAILCRTFGGTQHGSPSMVRPYRSRRVRVCWITGTGGTLQKGWPRLVHDVSHDIFRARHPSLKPHAPAHVSVERELTLFAIAQGWTRGTLRREPRKLTREERRAAKRTQLVERIARWQTKAKRATTALRALQGRLKAHDRNATRAPSARVAAGAGALLVETLAAKPTPSASAFPIVIKMNAAALSWFAGCEEGAHEDGEQAAQFGVSAYEVLTRHKSQIEIRSMKEAALIEYAAQSGTFDQRYPIQAERVRRELKVELGAELHTVLKS